MKVRVLFALLVSALSLSAQAEEGFFHPWKLPAGEAPEHLYNAVHSTIHLALPTDEPGKQALCSASVLSNDGYVLTALHCVLDCLKKQVVHRTGAQDRPFRGFYDVYETLEREPHIKCEGLVSHDLGSDDPEVVYLGAGYSYGVNISPAFSEQAYDLFRRAHGDYAILKFDVHRERHCIPLASEAPATGERVWAIGFPAGAHRQAHSSNGISKYVSVGKVLPGVDSDLFVSTSPAQRERMHSVFRDDEQLFSDLDLYKGDSGGMTFNSRGELVGVNDAVLEGAEDKFYNPHALSYRALAIRREVAEALGESKASEIFACTPDYSEPKGWKKWFWMRLLDQ